MTPYRTPAPTPQDRRYVSTRIAMALADLAFFSLLTVTAIVGACHPQLPPRSGCAEGAQRCAADVPEQCSADHRWEPLQLACGLTRSVCVVGEHAHCAPADAAVVSDASDGGAE